MQHIINSTRISGLYGLIGLVFIFSTNVFAVEIDYKELYRISAPSVVYIYGTDDKIAVRGTGTIIEKSGLVLTNTHVVMNEGRPWESLFVFTKPRQVTGDAKNDLNQM